MTLLTVTKIQHLSNTKLTMHCNNYKLYCSVRLGI